MQTLRKKTSPCKYRNDPGRFFGDGVQFKAKLIGILEVGEARGDRMCQEALQDLKMAIRAAGEHKQRITIHVTIDGLRLRDEKTSDSLYHHPVHKISFIAQDMTDSRAFGYIFGSPDSGHRFFGIKTDKAASQVVLAMRDLFQVVFELKKKEIELARQQIQSKSIHDHHLASLSSLKSASGSGHNDLSGNNAIISGSAGLSSLSGISGPGSIGMSRLETNMDTKGVSKEMSPESVADLVDLEQELSSIQRGITQMERITPNNPIQPLSKDEDPFGDSFTNFPHAYNLLPPPESSRSRSKPSNKPIEQFSNAIGGSGGGVALTTFLSPASAADRSSPTTLQQEEDASWLHELNNSNDAFETTKANSAGGVISIGNNLSLAPLAASESTSTPTQQLGENFSTDDVGNTTASLPLELEESPPETRAVKSDAFTDLDPLGTGRTRPYVDKKYFFQELKNPPKKVLKDLSGNSGNSSATANTPLATTTVAIISSITAGMSTSESTFSQLITSGAVGDRFMNQEDLFDDIPNITPKSDEFERQQPKRQQATLVNNLITTNTTNNSKQTTDSHPTDGLMPGEAVMLPRDTDPFSPTRKKSDPFQEGDIFSKLDPFDIEFSAASSKTSEVLQRISPTTTLATTSATTANMRRTAPEVFNGPLQVSLPPERSISPTSTVGVFWKSDISRLERQSSVSPTFPGTGSMRSRPAPSTTSATVSSHMHATPSAMLKQQTVDVISSISNKKMPHLFGQARFSKRGDSNTINMRRLQESDSLSENETAPEPPPRPDLGLHSVEPPPLPPKKQFNDIVIRPRVTSGNTIPTPSPVNSFCIMNTTTSSLSNRYEFISSAPVKRSTTDVPPIPLPSRRVGRSDGSYPGPGRPRKPGHIEDDYLTPLGTSSLCGATDGLTADVPPLLPPPTQVSTRGRTQRQMSFNYKSQELYENKNEILQQQQATSEESTAIIPDITLSQLLTLGIDELAIKLNVPTSKLSTMTLVELTSYLSEFIEKSKPVRKSSKSSHGESVSPKPTEFSNVNVRSSVFKVNFDAQTTFVAKFDDTFGEDLSVNESNIRISESSFVANFEQFNEPPVVPLLINNAGGTPAIPSADRYAVFREIIDKELETQKQNVDLMVMSDVVSTNEQETMNEKLSIIESKSNGTTYEIKFENDADEDFLISQQLTSQPPTLKIDTKITEVVAQAKDRYAALRDIILVENLFDKKQQEPLTDKDYSQECPEFSDEFTEDQDVKQIIKSRASSGGDRLLDSRGLPAEPSSSVVTVDDDDDEEEDDAGGESSLDSNDKESGAVNTAQDQYQKLSTSTLQLDIDQMSIDKTKNVDLNSSNSNLLSIKQDAKFLTVAGTSGLSCSKDDLEIDELMQRAISNLSLDSRERISPATSTSVAAPGPRSTSATLTSIHSPISANVLQQRSPISLSAVNGSVHEKSAEMSPITAPLTVVSNLIDSATKQLSSATSTASVGGVDLITDSEISRRTSRKEAWATFDSPKTVFGDKNMHDKRGHRCGKTKSTLHLPPAPPSNTSQNDTAESPCSSDPRDEGWNKSRRCWPKVKERQQTSSSSRDLSPWDDETTDYQKQQQKRILSAQPPNQSHSSQSDRHGYYMRHARRMNSCDEDYDYEEEFNNRREQRKFKQGLSRSRDNFDLDSPNWCHHPVHHTWSPQDAEQAAAGSRIRSFERTAYERSTYGPPIYDKRGIGGVPGSNYDRRGGFDKRKYYRDYPSRPNYEFEEYGDQERYREPSSFEKSKMGRRSDYENVYDDGRSPMSMVYGGSRTRIDYNIYERERKSFDRDSVESFESATRRRRSFGSGDVYGSLESREEFRERYMMGSGDGKSRSLRKSMKLRATGDIDYEQDSENDYHQRSARGGSGVSGVGVLESRSLQRPSQLISASGNSMSRMRKSSGSSPWDGEEPQLPGQKSSWKRPGSATESERRLAEGRRVVSMGQTPSGSDGEKDRRFRKKTRLRGKEYAQNSGVIVHPVSSAGNNARYGYPPTGNDIDNDNEDDEEDYVDEEYDEPPTDEDKFERLNRRRHEMHQCMLETERRQHVIGKNTKPMSSAAFGSSVPKRYHHHSNIRNLGIVSGSQASYDIDDYDEQTPTPRSNASSALPTSSGAGGASTKFSFDGGGFESDFNQSSPPPAPIGATSSCNSTPVATASVTSGAKASFRFSNDFSDREKIQHFAAQNSTSISSLQQYDLDTISSPASHTQKLRFDDKVKISQFDDAAFEDDFSKASFDFTKSDEQWQNSEGSIQSAIASTVVTGVTGISGVAGTAPTAKKQNLRNSKLQQRQELIKKSESINIFAKKAEDPFEDDEFFMAPTHELKPTTTTDETIANEGISEPATDKQASGNGFQWESENNFAKFDENM